SEAGFFRPARNENHLEHHEVVGVLHSDEGRRVQEAVAGMLVDDLEEVVRGSLEDLDQRLLDCLRHGGEASLVGSAIEDVNFSDWHGSSGPPRRLRDVEKDLPTRDGVAQGRWRRCKRVSGGHGYGQLAFGNEPSAELNAVNSLRRFPELRSVEPESTDGDVAKDHIETTGEDRLAAHVRVQDQGASVRKASSE